ncbi:MAG: phosphopantetheine-binding protein [Paludibacteraceae bacterium]
MKTFIANFADQFDDTELSVFAEDTRFRDLDEWSSLVGLAVLNMIAKKYNVRLTPEELKSVNTIAELFNLVSAKSI